MKVTLILDPAPPFVRASLVEEWDEAHGTARMAPRVRLFEREAEAIHWGRILAGRRGVGRLYLIDNRKSPPR